MASIVHPAPGRTRHAAADLATFVHARTRRWPMGPARRARHRRVQPDHGRGHRVAQEIIVMFEPFSILAIAGFVAFIVVIARLGGDESAVFAACSAGPAPSAAPSVSRRTTSRPSASVHRAPDILGRRRSAPDAPTTARPSARRKGLRGPDGSGSSADPGDGGFEPALSRCRTTTPLRPASLPHAQGRGHRPALDRGRQGGPRAPREARRDPGARRDGTRADRVRTPSGPGGARRPDRPHQRGDREAQRRGTDDQPASPLVLADELARLDEACRR